MQDLSGDISALAEEFRRCQKTLLALGDETRQHIVLEMMQIADCQGVRVGTITQKTHLSRPAVSHHLQILKDAGILEMRREGTKNYYSFDTDAQAIHDLMRLLEHARSIMEQLQSQSGE